MMRIITVLASVALGIFFAQVLWAKEFGIIMDVSGQPSLNRDGQIIHVEVGQELLVGDIINVPDQSQLVFVTYETCEELTFDESAEVLIVNEDKIVVQKGQLLRLKQLPVCYKPESFVYDGPNITGGILLRGAKPGPSDNLEEIARMRKAAIEDKTTNSELMSLIIFDLQNDDESQARSYYEQLMRKNPEASVPAPVLKKLGIN